MGWIGPAARDALVLLVVVCCVLALGLLARMARAAGRRPAAGGAAPRRPSSRPDPAKSPHLVVDTLNLTHWWLAHGPSARPPAAAGHGEPRAPPAPSGGGPLSLEAILATIEATAPALRARHQGRVMYVLKDRETQSNDAATREALRLAAERAGAYIICAEKYPDPPAGAKSSFAHSSRGRDDFLMCLLASRWRCAVLTEDRLRDFGRFRATIPPFHVYEFAPWRELPEREYVRPDAAAYARLRRPRMVRYADHFEGAEKKGPAMPVASAFAATAPTAIVAPARR